MRAKVSFSPLLSSPPGGGRPTDPSWSDKRLVPIAPRTLKRLERMAKRLHEHTGIRIEPMQLAAILLETTTENVTAEDAIHAIVTRGVFFCDSNGRWHPIP